MIQLKQILTGSIDAWLQKLEPSLDSKEVRPKHIQDHNTNLLKNQFTTPPRSTPWDTEEVKLWKTWSQLLIVLAQVDMCPKHPLIHQTTITSQGGLFQRQEEQMMTKGDQIEIRPLTLDLALADNLTQKIELGKNVILDLVTVVKQLSLDSLPTRCKEDQA